MQDADLETSGRVRLLELLEELNLDRLTSRIEGLVTSSIAGYRLHSQQWGARQTRTTALANLELFRDLVREPVELGGERLEPARAAARAAAQCGMPMTDLLRSYHLGYEVVFEGLSRLAGEDPAPLVAGIVPFLALARQVDLVIVEAYTAAPERRQDADTGEGTSADGFLKVLRCIDLTALADRMVATILTQVPGFGRPPREAIRKRLANATTAQLSLFPRLVEQRRDATDEELEPFRDAARGHARDGVPLEDLLLAYQVGAAVAWDEVRRVTESTGDPSAGLVGTEPTMRYAEQLGTAVNQAYLEERDRIAREPASRHRALFDALVEDRALTPELRSLAAEIELDPDEPLRPVAQATSSPTDAGERAKLFRQRGLLVFGEGELLIGACQRPAALEPLLEGGGPYAFGGATSKPDLGARLAETRVLCAVGAAAGRSGQIGPGEFMLERLLLGSPELASSLEERVLRPIREQSEGRGIDLLPTLVTFVQSGRERKRTAEMLHVHPNTLDHRLRRFREITGLDPGRADDLASIELALKWRDLKSLADVSSRS